MTNASAVPAAALVSPPDPVHVLRGFASLRRLMGTYPIGHPMIAQKLKELDDQIRIHLRRGPLLEVDVVDGDVHMDGVSFGRDQQANAQAIRELADLGIDSIQSVRASDRAAPHRRGVLWHYKGRWATQPMERSSRAAASTSAWQAGARTPAGARSDDQRRRRSIRPTPNRWCSRSDLRHGRVRRTLDPVTVRDLVSADLQGGEKRRGARGILAVKR
jgi:hypothetical protein